MPRVARSLLPPEGVFHVTVRGVARTAICRDAVDFRALQRQLDEVARRFSWDVCAYCLMPNHFHLVVATDLGRLSAGMQRLNGLYAQRFNRRHDRVGHVFQNRFWSSVIDDEEHFVNAIAYVASNPVDAGLCTRSVDWPWAASRFDSDMSEGLSLRHVPGTVP